MAIMLSTIPRTRWTLAAPDAQTRAASTADEQPRNAASPALLSRTGRLLLTEHFVRQLRKKLYDQKDVLALVDHSQSWVLEVVDSEFDAVSAAATLIKKHYMASVAARGEVLVEVLTHRVVIDAICR